MNPISGTIYRPSRWDTAWLLMKLIMKGENITSRVTSPVCPLGLRLVLNDMRGGQTHESPSWQDFSDLVPQFGGSEQDQREPQVQLEVLAPGHAGHGQA